MPDAMTRLLELTSQLPDAQVQVLTEMAEALLRPVECVVRDRGIVSLAFEANFSAHLRLFHAMHDAPLTKKTFEYFFCAASRATGRRARQTSNDVHPGEDVVVDGVPFSLKTEGGKSISRSAVHISKLMEARWIRDCATGAEFADGISNVVDHLRHYQRIITLRSFVTRRVRRALADEDETSGIEAVEYDLIEVPLSVMNRVSSLTARDFTPRTPNGSTSAVVRGTGGQPLFTLRLDGSVEKVTVANLGIGACSRLATWKVKVLPGA